jgi:nucleoid-associated protein YgaU
MEPAAAPSPAPSPVSKVDEEVAPNDAGTAIAAVPAPSDAASEPPAARPETFREIVVPRGTSLSTLAQQYYGEGNPRLVKRIRELNPQIRNVDQIFAGDKLRLPPLEEVDRPNE